jgi:hypothetical protein
MKENNAMSRYSKTMSDTMAEVRAKEEELLEVSPPGFKGTVKAMKKHDDIDNPYALAWHMKNKGDEAHYKNKDGKPEKKEKYKEDVDEANLPPHLSKFFDKKGNPKPEVAKRMANAAKAKKAVVKDVTPKGYGPNEEAEVEEGFGKLKDASKNLEKMHKAAGVEVDKKTTKKTKGGIVQTTTYKKRQEEVDDIHAEALRENDIVEEVEWKVQLRGLPIFYVPAKSAGEVRAMLRKQIKKPDDILSIERSTKAAKKKDFRDRVSGKETDS